MQIVIEIPEEMYKWMNDVNKFFDDYGTSDFIDLVKNGILLPKGHGRLIDENNLIKEIEDDIVGNYFDMRDWIRDSDAIMEADKEE